jgi:dephospho-CoA kinase
MIVIGLTGSIGMGKTTTAEMFKAAGVPVISADAIVHELYRGEAAPLIDAAFPGAAPDGVVDRKVLSTMLLADPEGFERLEAIIHPLVRAHEQAFLDQAAGRRPRNGAGRYTAALRNRRPKTGSIQWLWPVAPLTSSGKGFWRVRG